MCALLTIGTQILPAQPAGNQSGILPVTITDPLNRFVTGLDKETSSSSRMALRDPSLISPTLTIPSPSQSSVSHPFSSTHN